MRRISFLVVALLFLFSAPGLQAQCGVERWSVKTGTDPDASKVSLSTYISTNIYNMWSSTRPSSLPANNRVAPRETNQYRITGTLTKYKLETDSDYHLVIQDSSGRTMIIEIPSPNCVGSGSPFLSGIRNARNEFDAKLTATTSFKSVSAPIAIRGVGFWDYLHGQTGVAPNGIEVHPVLDIAFTGTIVQNVEPGVVAQATHPPVALPDDMVEDNDGGRVEVYRGHAFTGEVLYHGGSVIEQPRLRVVFAGAVDAATKTSATAAARALTFDRRTGELERYGVRTAAVTIDSDDVATGLPADANDLDVQRLLANAVESGRIQHLDENVITVVVVPADAHIAVGTTTDWSSYHSLFHPTEVGMPYVVVKGGPTLRDAMFASVARAMIDPKGDGWY